MANFMSNGVSGGQTSVFVDAAALPGFASAGNVGHACRKKTVL